MNIKNKTYFISVLGLIFFFPYMLYYTIKLMIKIAYYTVLGFDTEELTRLINKKEKL
jgi:uncharacterized membrane protein